VTLEGVRARLRLLRGRIGAFGRHCKASRPMTQGEVARALGCTRANVSMTELRALRKLRRALELLGIDGPATEPEGFQEHE